MPKTSRKTKKSVKKIVKKVAKRRVTKLLPKKEARFSDEQIQVFKLVERALKKKLGVGKKGFTARYHAIIPSRDEIFQMGVQSAATCMTRAIQLASYTPTQKEVIAATRYRLIHEMDFRINLDRMPSTERIAKIGKDAAVDELFYSSKYWGGIFP